MSAKKTAEKTARSKPSPLTGQTLPLGAHPKNTGGKKGRSGRKPFLWKEHCRDVLIDKTVREHMLVAARTPKLPGYAPLIKMLASYAEGLPEQTIILEHESPIEELLRELDGIAARRRATKNPRKTGA